MKLLPGLCNSVKKLFLELAVDNLLTVECYN